MSHVNRNLVDSKNTHPCLNVNVGCIGHEINVTTCPQEVPFSIEENVPGEHDLS